MNSIDAERPGNLRFTLASIFGLTQTIACAAPNGDLFHGPVQEPVFLDERVHLVAFGSFTMNELNRWLPQQQRNDRKFEALQFDCCWTIVECTTDRRKLLQQPEPEMRSQ